MTMTTLQLRKALCERGYAGSVIPCDGKAPTLACWQGKVANDAYSMARWRGLNTGLKTALNPVVDIDIMDPEAADLVEITAKDYFDGRGIIPTRFGKAPRRALIFRATNPFPKMISIFESPRGEHHKIEILGDGQQLIVARRASGHRRALHLPRRAAMEHQARGPRRGYRGRDDGPPRLRRRRSQGGARMDAPRLWRPSRRRKRAGERIDARASGRRRRAPGRCGAGRRQRADAPGHGLLLRHGISVEETVSTVLEALRRAIPGGSESDWARRQAEIEGQCFRLIRKEPELYDRLPDKLRDRWARYLAAGADALLTVGT